VGEKERRGWRYGGTGRAVRRAEGRGEGGGSGGSEIEGWGGGEDKGEGRVEGGGVGEPTGGFHGPGKKTARYGALCAPNPPERRE